MSRIIFCACFTLLVVGLTVAVARADVVDNRVPLNYGFHALGHGVAPSGEASDNPANSVADVILYRSIADRGLYLDPADSHAFGTVPLVGNTGLTYSLFDTLGYGNTTYPNAGTYGLDAVFMGSRGQSAALEVTINPNTNIGVFPAWTPHADIISLSGDGSTVTATTAASHGLVAGSAVVIGGATPTSYNGTYWIQSVPTPTTFTYTNSSTAAAAGSILANGILVSSLTGDGTNATVTTSVAHLLAVGASVTIEGANPAGYNGTYTIATVPSSTTFTYANATAGAATGTIIRAYNCDHGYLDEVTTLASPVLVDATTEVGVLYMISDSGGQLDVVLTFNNGAVDTNVTARVGGPDWYGVPSDLPMISPFVISQKKIPHSVSGTSYNSFRATANNDTCKRQAFVTGGGGPNLNVTEAVISVQRIIAAGYSVAGQQLTKVTFKNALWPVTSITGLTGTGTVATATVSSTSGYMVGQPITISGVSPAAYNGNYVIASIPSGTTFTFATTATGTTSGKIYANTTPVTSISVSGGVATVTTDSAHGLAVNDLVTITGSSNAGYIGTWKVATVADATHFTFATVTTGTPSGQRQVTRIGRGRGYSIYAATARTGIQANADCATPIIVATTNNVLDLPTSNLHAGSGTTTSSCGTNDTSAVWFQYNAATTVPVLVSTCTASFDTTVAIYTGTCGALTQVACSDNYSGCGTNGGRVMWLAEAGQSYLIRVGGNNGATGSFTLHVEDYPAPANGTCATAQVITGGDTSGLTNVRAFDGMTSSCGGGNDISGVWFAYTPTVSNTAEARVWTYQVYKTRPFDSTLAVYTGTCGSLTEVVNGCNDNYANLFPVVTWPAVAGTTYYLRVAGVNGATHGNFTLSLDEDFTHTDLAMPIQFNWNGTCHGTDPSGSPSEQTIPSSGSGIGSIHENRYDLNGYRGISDRGLLCDGVATDALNYLHTIGWRGLEYTVYGEPLQSDIVHLGNRSGTWPWSPDGTLWPAEGGTSTALSGLRPIWLSEDDHTGQQTSSMTGMNAVFGPDTKIGILYHASNIAYVNPQTYPDTYAHFDVTLTFTDDTSVAVTVYANDWYCGSGDPNPANMPLPDALPGAGIEKQRILGCYHGVQNTDKGDDAGQGDNAGNLKVCEAVISTASLLTLVNPTYPAGFDATGRTLREISFGNPMSAPYGGHGGDSTHSAFAIFAATMRDPASYNLNYPPGGTGTFSPNQIVAGARGKLLVKVSRGSGSPNNITSVVVDGSSIGLSGTLALNDSGQNGDLHANDNWWSRNIDIPVDTPLDGKSFPFTVTDAQGRTATGNIYFTVQLPTVAVTPASVVMGGTFKTTVHLSNNNTPTPGIASVILDAGALGLGNVTLRDNGTGGDVTANDGVYSADTRIPLSVFPGDYFVSVTITDTLGHAFYSPWLPMTVTPPVVTLNPAQGAGGETVLCTVNMGNATGITSITIDASAFGLGVLALYDDGTHGDVTAGDGIWSVSFVVPVGTPAGSYTLPITVSAAEGSYTDYSATFSILLALDPIQLTGFNRDVVVERTAGLPFNDGDAEYFDLSTGSWTFYENGLAGGTLGLPQGGSFASTADPSILAHVQLAPYGNGDNVLAPNALWMTAAPDNTGTLTFAPAARVPYNRLAIIATSASGGGTGILTINFADGTSDTSQVFDAPDWYDGSPYALAGLGRVDIATGTFDDRATNPRLYQTTLDLAAFGLNQKAIRSLTFEKPAAAGSTAVFAVSGWANPDPVGACCYPDTGLCCVTTPWSCESGNWTEGLACSADGHGPCPQPTGVCCYPNGSCLLLTPIACENSGGLWHIGSYCNDCPQPGACCLADGSCTFELETACSSEGGFFAGQGVSCASAACPLPGSCCFSDGSCQMSPSTGDAWCTAQGGSYRGDGTDCSQPCPLPGACCLPDGSCVLATELGGASCTAQNGAYQGDGTTCEGTTCPQPGACCFYPDEHCTSVLEAVCVGQGGTFHGEGVSCSSDPCPHLAWACCFADMSCIDATEADCAAYGYGGRWSPGFHCADPGFVCPGPNLLINPGAETGDLTGWTLDLNGGNGWGTTAEANNVHSGLQAFTTSYAWDTRHQTVDLVAAGYSAELLDTQPAVLCSEWIHTRGDSGGQYFIRFELLDASQQVLAFWENGTETAPITLPAGTPYFEETQTFSGYGPGLRYIKFIDGGKDTTYWAGHFGTHFDDAYAGLQLSTAGACCLQDETCSEITAADCVTQGGTYHLGLTCSPNPCVPQVSTGDLNCDGAVNTGDIPAFALALIDPTAYGNQYPGCEISRADTNSDGLLNGADIQGFVDALLTP